MRLRLGVLIAGAMLALGVAAGASASRIQVKPSHALEYFGHDWVGKVRVEFTEIDTNRGDVFALYAFTFANECSRRGSALKDSIPITIRRDNRFQYQGHGFTVTGNVIGKRAAPKEIVGLATVSRNGCTSGPWWFEVKP
ncbi:MAG: hypothetical protein WAK93_21710 [Solirubrobacteraceae bacterium]